MSWARPARERGSVTPLIIGLAVIVMLLATAVVDASKVFLVKRDLAAATDGAALAAADGISAASIYQGGVGDHVVLSAQLARLQVQRYVADNGLRARFGGLAYGTSVDGDEVTVRFQTRVDLPFVNLISSQWSNGVPVASVASATAFAE